MTRKTASLYVSCLSLALTATHPERVRGDDRPGAHEFKAAAAVLINRCYECHNPNERSGGLDLSSRDGFRKGGQSGEAFVAGHPDESFLIERVAGGEMPPKKAGQSQALARNEVDVLFAWIKAGAPWPEEVVLDPFQTTTDTRAGLDFWSLQPIRRTVPPSVAAALPPLNPVDAYISAPLEARGWTRAPEADRATLIRRLYIDLIGYPPTYEEIEDFKQDPAPDAYERLVDRLLASPHYGERWGRHWLDVARYADTCGYERDQTKPNAWKYRDWIIACFNEDTPLDRFIVQQLAGDEMPGRSESSVIATAFIQLGTWNDEPNDPQEYKYERLEDMVHATSTAFLGLTVKCARCHDHKFDPIRQTDYYRLAAAFWAGPIEPGARELLGGPDAKTLGFDVFGWTDVRPDPPPIHLLKKGDPTRPGDAVAPGHLSMVPSLARSFEAPGPEAKTSLRRLQIARWIADPANPLTARVWVNRIWQHHFGEGLVRSPDNFGFTGERPTHAELLDWLAARLIDGGYETKPIHRLLLLSAAYRQSSVHPQAEMYAREDASNRLWWHAERRRLDAEALRDTLLTASGALDGNRMGGPGFVPSISPEALEGLSMKDKAWTPSAPDEQRRRSVYLFAKRGLLAPLMTTFDSPDTTLPCGRRDVTLVAPQALSLMNAGFVHEQSQALARAVITQSPPDDNAAHVRLAWRLALGRDPDAREAAAALAHLQAQRARLKATAGAESPESARARALASLCHVLLNTNEFLFVD